MPTNALRLLKMTNVRVSGITESSGTHGSSNLSYNYIKIFIFNFTHYNKLIFFNKDFSQLIIFSNLFLLASVLAAPLTQKFLRVLD